MASSSPFNPDTDIPSLAGKVIFITGSTGGLGAGAVAELAKHSPSHIILSGRNEKNANTIISRVNKSSPNVKLTFLRCDISSLISVREAAQKFSTIASRLDILMLNAGIMAVPASISPEGYEIQFATNHLGHALLVKLLMPTLLSTAELPDSDVRVINLTSYAYQNAPKQGIDFDTLKSNQSTLGNALNPGHRWARYGQSKLANLLYSQQLAKHYPSITSVSVHPGFILGTGLFDGLPLMTKLPALLLSIGKQIPVEQGHWNQCWAATQKVVNGGYYEPTGKLVRPTTKQGNDEKLAERLWEWTEEATGGFE